MKKMYSALSAVALFAIASKLIGMEENSLLAAPPQKIEGSKLSSEAMEFVNPTLELVNNLRSKIVDGNDPEGGSDRRLQTLHLTDAIIAALKLKSNRDETAPVLKHIILGIPDFKLEYVVERTEQAPQWAYSEKRPVELGGYSVTDDTDKHKDALLASLKEPLVKRPLNRKPRV